MEVTLRGVAFCEELVYYARRCGRHASRLPGEAPRWSVVVERLETGSGLARVSVAGRWKGRSAAAVAADLDEYLAMRNAFALAAARLDRASAEELAAP